MSGITRADIHQNVALQELSVAVALGSRSLSREFFPVVGVTKDSDSYRTWDTGVLKRDDMKPRAPGTRAARTDLKATYSDYTCKAWALGYEIPWEEIRNDDLGEIDMVALAALQEKAAIREHLAFLSTYFTTSIWTGVGIGGSADGSPGTKWDQANSTPLSDMRTMLRGVQKGSGAQDRRNIKGLCPRRVFDALMDNAEIKAQLQPTRTDMLTPELLSTLLGCGPILVDDLIYDSAAKGQTSSLGFASDDALLFLYVPSSPGRLTPAAGYTFVAPVIDGDGMAQRLADAGGVAVRQYDETAEMRTVYEGHLKFAHVQPMATAGVFASNVLNA